MEEKEFPYCPARDKTTGQCFGLTWFKHKPGPGKYILCSGDCSARRDWQKRYDKRFDKTLLAKRLNIMN